MSVEKLALVVDDDPDCCAYAGAMLESDGWKVVICPDGHACMEVLGRLTPQLIVLDIQMPEMDGFGVWHRIVEKGDALSATKVIMLTGIEDKTGFRFSQQEMGEYFTKAPDAYIEKPVDSDIFLNTVTELCSVS